MQTQLYPAASHLNPLPLKYGGTAAALDGAKHLIGLMSLASPSSDGAKCSSLLQVRQAVVKTIRSVKSYFLVLIMEKRQHTRNISLDNRANQQFKGGGHWGPLSARRINSNLGLFIDRV